MKNWKLELLRGSASILVFFCHIVLINPYLRQKTYLNILSNWGTESVIIFFILSGIVINITNSRKLQTFKEFLINRVLRIYPQYIIGILLAIIVPYIIRNDLVPIKTLIGSLVFLGTLQNYIVSIPYSNPVVWSLSFEMFFYLIFSLSLKKHQKQVIIFWLLISISSILFYYSNMPGLLGYFIAMFSFSSIWLIGYYIFEYKYLFKVQNSKVALIFLALLPSISRLHLSNQYYDVGKYLLFSITSIPFFLYCLEYRQTANLRKPIIINRLHALLFTILSSVCLVFYSNSLFVSKILYISLPILLVLFSFLKLQINISVNMVKKISLILGSLSYSIYIIHYPILLLINHFFSSQITLYIILSILITLWFSFYLENKYQLFITRYFKEIFRLDRLTNVK